MRFVEQALGFVNFGPAAIALSQLLIQEALFHFFTPNRIVNHKRQ
jgi:hypothetical protein